MTRHEPDTEELLRQAGDGDAGARQLLLGRHRDRLRRMVAARWDRRLAGRLDPSDVVQDVLAEAARKLPDYLRQRPLPFYPWLRQMAWERLIELRRQHIYAGKRSVAREEHDNLEFPDESVWCLAGRLFAPDSSPSQRAVREETRRRVRDALGRLKPNDRELLVLRHLEQLSLREIAGVLGASEGAVKVRHVRALERLRVLLGDDLREDQP